MPQAQASDVNGVVVDGSHLIGELDPDGTARFEVDSKATTAGSTSPSDEDYDHVATDPSTVLEGSHGGAVSGPSLAGRRASILAANGGTKGDATNRPRNSRRKSVPIKLQPTDIKGRYLLRADDPALEDILQRVVRGERNTKARTRFSDLVFTRQFTAFDRQNPSSGGSPFHGFFTLFWLCIVFMLVKIAANNYRATGSIFGTHELLTMMFSSETFVVCLSDVFMMSCTVFCLILQKAVHADWISWNKTGWLLQSVWQLGYLVITLRWTIHREWPWQHNVFITLHCIVMLMKQHSFAFYNGHLSEVYKRKKSLQAKLEELGSLNPTTAGTPASPIATRALATSYFDQSSPDQLKRRRRSLHHASDLHSEQDEADMQSVVAAIRSGDALSINQVEAFERVLETEIEALEKELTGKCTDTENHYPLNLTLINFIDYIPLPTVVYELEYPRLEKISWNYVAEKAAATFGVLGVMIVVSQAFIYPVVMDTLRMKELDTPLSERLRAFPWILNDLLFPFLVEYLMSWYVIWECILNLLAELTRFADRGFYADWWNSVSWDQFARDWNVPVHNFLLRHVYHSSISSFRVSKGLATLITFLLSAIVHELVMWSIFHKLRGYLLCMQMLQLPLVMLSKSRFLKERKVLGNVIFWIGIFAGPSLLCSLYLII